MNKDYDERQIAIRYKYGFHAFLLLMILMTLNAFVMETVYVWADNLVSTFVVILITALWYGMRTIMAGAYFYANPQKTKSLMIISSILAFIYACLLLVRVIAGHLQIVENGKATTDIISVISVIMFVFLAIASIINWTRRSKE